MVMLRYSNGTMTNLGALGGTSSSATGLNNRGEVVGYYIKNYFRAFVYRDGVMTDLNTSIPPDSGWIQLNIADAINDAGMIIGLGYRNGSEHGFLLIPANVPVADAGPDQSVNEGDLVTLSAVGSSAGNQGSLTYQWSQIAGPAVTLNLSDPVRPTFTAPTVQAGGATLSFQLIVNDGQRDSEIDTVNITVKNLNHPPVADAGLDLSVTEGTPVTLNGGLSYDPNGDNLSYSWSQTGGPSVILNNSNAALAYFTAPPVTIAGAVLSFQLTVDDGLLSAQDSVIITVENINHAPVAHAGAAQTVDEGSTVTLNGGASYDPDGDSLSFHWTQTGGTHNVTLSDANSVMPSFIAPAVNPGGDTLTFTLIVNDGGLDSAPETVAISIQDINDPPACDKAQASITTLWPPNHKLVPLRITQVADPNGDAVSVSILGVSQDEPVSGLGDGDTSPDAVIGGNDGVLLRAERSGQGDGRVYSVHFRADDENGGICTGKVIVGVPHNRASAPVDSGQNHTSTQ